MTTTSDPVSSPKHYTSHPSGIEVIRITEHMNFCLGNAIKYILRADFKGETVQDLEKARWYIDREIGRLKAEDRPHLADWEKELHYANCRPAGKGCSCG